MKISIPCTQHISNFLEYRCCRSTSVDVYFGLIDHYNTRIFWMVCWEISCKRRAMPLSLIILEELCRTSLACYLEKIAFDAAGRTPYYNTHKQFLNLF